MAIQVISYCTIPNNNFQVLYDDVLHTILADDFTGTPAVCESPVIDGDVIFVDEQVDAGGITIGEYRILARPALTFFLAEVIYVPIASPLCNAAIIDTIIIPESVTGANDAQVTLVSSPESGLEFNIDGGTFQASKVFSGLGQGTFVFGVRRADNLCEGISRTVDLLPSNQLSASFVKTNVTATGLSDGTITVTVVGGSGNYSFLWSDAVTTQNRTALPVGVLSLTITDITSLVTFDLNNISIDEPAIVEPIIGTILDVPQVNSLRFVDNSVIDQCNNPQNADNTFLLEQGDRFMKRDPYFQKVNKCDILNVQIQSDFALIVAELRSCLDDSVKKTFEVTKLVTSLGSTSTLNIRIQNDGAGRSRVYFTASQSVPILIEVGDPFEIINNADGFNGVYEVLNVLNDDLLGSQFLLINKNYGIAAPSTLGEGVFKDEALDFDISNIRMDFSGLLDGNYFVRIGGFNGASEDAVTKSEPLSLSDNHEATIKIDFTNIDNAFNIDYQSGTIHQIRVPARMVKAVPAASQTSIRSTDAQVTKLSAKPERKYNLEFFNLPTYMHELISLAFNHDTVLINGVEFGSQDGLAEPSYIDGYNLADSSIIVEQTEWFKTINGDDLGGVDDNGFIDNEQGGFITLN